MLQTYSRIAFSICLFCALSGFLFQCTSAVQEVAATATTDFTAIAYQNPELLVDLGVGLWPGRYPWIMMKTVIWICWWPARTSLITAFIFLKTKPPKGRRCRY